jgi:hypothetical protein
MIAPPADLSSAQARQFASDLEDAVTKALEAGLSPEASICVMAMCIGYAVSNGNPCEGSMRASLVLAQDAARRAAEAVFATRGGGMVPKGTA